MKLLVTGGTTFVSRYTAEYFAQRGNSVFVLNRGSRPQPQGVEAIIADKTDLGDCLHGMVFDAVLDVTAYTAGHVRALLDSGVRFGQYLLISSSAVYTDTGVPAFTEDMPCGNNSVWGIYGQNKWAAEQLLHSRVPDAYILRPPYLYGKYNNLYREAFVFECAAADRAFCLPRDGSMRLQFFHVKDLCRVMETLLTQQPAGRVYNVGNREAVSIREWVRLCYQTAGKEPRFVSVYEDIPQRDYFCFYDYEYYLDVSRMEKLLPETLSLEEGLKDSYEWWKKYPETITNWKPYTGNIDKKLQRD